MAKSIDEIGNKYGLLEVVGKELVGNKIFWRCVCECGGTKLERGNVLRRGRTTDCGCGKEAYREKLGGRENITSEYEGYLPKSRNKLNQTAEASKYPQGYFKDKECRRCKTVFTPVAPSELYCSDRCVKESRLDKYFNKAYGLSFIEYDAMYKAQKGRCAICGGEGFAMRENAVKLVVDHNHKTGKIRGLLCHSCNRGLGLFQDNAEFLKTAVTYLGGTT